MRKLKPWLVVSLTIAGASLVSLATELAYHFLELFFLPSGPEWVLASFVLALIWLLVVIAGLFFLRWRGLWLFLGLPAVAHWLALCAWIVTHINEFGPDQ